MIDIRDSLFNRLVELARDPDVMILSDDFDAFALRQFQKDFPNRMINTGVCEQNLINVAAGLAMSGKKVFCLGICSFMTARCLEQIRINLCSMKLPVTIVGVGPGFSFNFDGPTHHGLTDIALMRTLPEMQILNPADEVTARKAVELAYQKNGTGLSQGPTYIRLDKGVWPVFEFTGDMHRPIHVDATGTIIHSVVRAISQLPEPYQKLITLNHQLDVTHKHQYHMAYTRHLVTIEEHSSGGLGTVMAEYLAAHYQPHIQLTCLKVPDQQFISYGSRDWFLEQCGLTVEKIRDTLKTICEKETNRLAV